MAEDLSTGKRIPYERKWAGDNKAKAIIAMTHPMAVIIFSLLTLILAILTLPEIMNPLVLISLELAMVATQGSIGIFNDVFDWKLDKEYKPWRAIPAGVITPRSAALMASLLLCLGLLFAASISLIAMSVLLVMAGIGILYSARLKRTIFSWLPYVVAYPSLPVWVMVALDRFDLHILSIYLLAAPFVLAVHICNQLRDYEEDSILGIRGLVQQLGREKAIFLCFVLLLVSPLPFMIMVGYSDQPIYFMILLTVGLFHWWLSLPIFMKYRDSLSAHAFRSLFRRLQISGPLMLITWYWVFVSTLN